MTWTDFNFVLHWWFLLFGIGLLFLPFALCLFSSFIDKGYIFAKILGLCCISYVVFVLGTLHILQFSHLTIFLTVFAFGIANIFLTVRYNISFSIIKTKWRIFAFEELLFFSGVFFWSFVRSTQPDIHGLEKFMDFGFVNSILRSTYFPPKDMWYTPYPINYYYFGHLVTATLTKLSDIPSSITFNLMLATLFAFTFVGSFSITINLISQLFKGEASPLRPTQLDSAGQAGPRAQMLLVIISGLLTAFLTTFAGNLHILYAFFKAYPNESPVPFWQLALSPLTFPNGYWYPNATRFIFHTIHEFPIYSFVVSDLHGHVLDIPFVFLTIAVLFSLVVKSKILNTKYQIPNTILLGFLVAVMYMTNAWDGGIYLLLSITVLLCILLQRLKIVDLNFFIKAIIHVGTLLISFIIFSFPFSHFFNAGEIAHGVGVLCTPTFLTNIGKVGPFLFEPDHCQHSPLYQLTILYGFFYFWVILFFTFLLKKRSSKSKALNSKQFQNAKSFGHSNFQNLNLFRNLKLDIRDLNPSDLFVVLLIALSTLLIIIPEFVYLKDIYPAHYRANTMFKLVYQSFMLLSISSGYIFVRLVSNIKYQIKNIKSKAHWILDIGYWIFGIFLFSLVGIYPYFAISSYYANLSTYYGLNGTQYLGKLYPTDYAGIVWINNTIPGQPVILEAQGDSYTDYARVSVNTGLPTVLGWTVHEWLWRGSYDILPERINDIKTIYETSNTQITKHLLHKYAVSLVFIGDLERQKYLQLNENKFSQVGKLIYTNGQTRIYRVDKQPRLLK